MPDAGMGYCSAANFHAVICLNIFSETRTLTLGTSWCACWWFCLCQTKTLRAFLSVVVTDRNTHTSQSELRSVVVADRNTHRVLYYTIVHSQSTSFLKLTSFLVSLSGQVTETFAEHLSSGGCYILILCFNSATATYPVCFRVRYIDHATVLRK